MIRGVGYELDANLKRAAVAGVHPCKYLFIKGPTVELIDIPNVGNWLNQFDIPDMYLAEHMLRRIRYVGFEEFETWLQASVRGLLDEIAAKDGRVAVAIFPVAKPFIHKFNKDKEEKRPNDSAGRIAHSLKNLERDLPKYVELTPRLESMREKRIRHIIFVDDFVGTGDRFTSSWRSTVPASVKSWCSRGWCKVWFIAFAAQEMGLRRIARKVQQLPPSQIRVNLTIGKSFFLESKSMQFVLEKYGERLGGKKQFFGYGGMASPVIFQYGCPNNVPLIFWKRPSNASRVKWRPLFPDRSVAAELYPLFSAELTREAMPEELWMAGHHQLALNVLNRISQYKESHQYLLVLGLLSKGRDIDKIKNTMVLSDDEFNALLDELRHGGLIDESNAVTRFGRDVIARATRPKKMDVAITEETNFFPSSFLGFQRGA